MDLYLIRHAKAHDPDPARWPDDHDRPLSASGEELLQQVARAISTIVPEVNIVLRSPYLRARQTADVLCAVADWPEALSTSALEPGKSQVEVVHALTEYRGVGALALVGHEPLLSHLASYLLVGELVRANIKMRPGSILYMSFDAWPGMGNGTIQWLLDPRTLNMALRAGAGRRKGQE